MRRSWLILLVVGALGTGCFEDGSGVDTLEKRWGRRFLPPEDQWRKASEIPSEPQEWPQMVIWELTEFEPGTPIAPEHLAAAADLVERSYEAAERNGWYDYRQGIADGYRLLPGDKRHYQSDEKVLDDRLLDPDQPEFLMYHATRKGRELTGFMFYVRKPADHGPQIGGNLTKWHYHVWSKPKCLIQSMAPAGELKYDRCPRGVPMFRSPEMLHVWLLDHPDGNFATGMYVEPELLAELLDKRRNERPETQNGVAH